MTRIRRDRSSPHYNQFQRYTTKEHRNSILKLRCKSKRGDPRSGEDERQRTFPAHVSGAAPTCGCLCPPLKVSVFLVLVARSEFCKIHQSAYICKRDYREEYEKNIDTNIGCSVHYGLRGSLRNGRRPS